MTTKRIIVIDDEFQITRVLKRSLGAHRYDVRTASDGGAGIDLFHDFDPDLVITDLSMPEMDGWETARLIRKAWPGLKIVLVTGYGPTTTPPPGEEDLVDAIIGKPFDFTQVGSTLNTLTRELCHR